MPVSFIIAVLRRAAKIQLRKENSSNVLDTAGTPLRTQRIWLAILYLYLASPLILQAAAGTRWDLVFTLNAAATVLWMAFLHFCVRRPLYLHLALLPLYGTTAADLFVLQTFGARLDSGYVTIALANQSDAVDFLSSFCRPLVVMALACPLIYLAGLYHIRGLRLSRSPYLALLAAGTLAASYVMLARHFRVWTGEPAQAVLFDVVAHETSAPLGVIFQTVTALKLQAENTGSIARRAQFAFGATRPPERKGEIFVWVVGESSRPENWSLFGYGRDTTPRLRGTPGIVRLTDVLTTAPETRLAVPSMLSLSPITDWRSVQTQKSVVAAFDEAGFDTFWLSTQEVDAWAGIVPQIATEADTVRYFSQSLDGALLGEFQKILESRRLRDGNLFVVLHTKGSHFDYDRRYPPEFAHFASAHAGRREKIVDAYDNSILYTDWFLSEVISMLARTGSEAALLYSSDHGENLLDDSRKLLGHTRGTTHDLSAAAFFWFSDEMRAARGDLLANLERNATQPLSLSNLPHSMLDLAGISVPPEDPSLSVFNPGFTLHPRFFIMGGQLHPEAI